MKKVIVVGAGLVGSLQALYMAKRGYRVAVYERRPDLRKANIIGGRSINLALSNRGWKALAKVGMEEKIREISIPMKGRIMHSMEGELTFQPYGLEGQAIYSVSRGELNRQLLLEAEKYENVSFHFDQRCVDINLDTNTAIFQDENSGETTEVTGVYIFGTDGAFSSVRNRLMRTDRFNYSQTYLTHGYKELVIPPDQNGAHCIDKNALHIWPRGTFMMIALANLDGSFTVTLFFPFEGPQSFASLQSKEDVIGFFKEVFPDALDHMPDLASDYFENPTSSLVTVKCSPWNYGSKVLLLGDAAHAIVPFYGQGMNAGFEDCYLLDQLLESNNGNLDETIPQFAASRKPDGDAIADLAVDNFIEMRDKVADQKFLLQKRIEKRFFQKYPDKWMPLYSMVTFSDVPYSTALSTGRKQQAIMDEIMEMSNIEQQWDTEEVEKAILKKIS